MTTVPRFITVLLLVGIVGLAILPFVAERFHVQLASQMMVMAIFAMSLDLLVGFTGLVSFGHAAFFGLAGYALALAGHQAGFISIAATLPLSLAVCGLAALMIGWLSIRTSGVYFIMVTLAFAQMIYFFFNDARGFGGSDGLYVTVKPILEIAGYEILNLRDRTTFHYVALSAMIGTYLLLKMVLCAPYGQVLTAIRINEGRTRALGYPIARYKLVSFVIAGMLAGLAGYLGAAQYGFVNPAHLGWRESGRALVIVILGGSGTLFGPALGAFVFVLLEDILSGLTEHWLLLMGAFVIAVVLLLPRGIAGLLLTLADRAPKRFREPVLRSPPAPVAEVPDG